MRFANLSPQERAKRKVEALEQLKRTFKKLDHDVNVEELTKPSLTAQNIEELYVYLQNIQMESLHLQQRLRGYESFQTMEEANKLEDFLQSRIQDVQVHKQLLEASRCIVPYGATGPQQVYLEAVGNPEVLNDTAPNSWEVSAHRPNEIAGLQQNFFDQSRQTTHPPNCLGQNAISLDKEVEGPSHLFSGLNQMSYKDTTTDSNKLRFEMAANCSKIVDYGESDPSSLDNSMFAQNGLSSHCHWPTNSNGMPCQSGIIALQNPKPHYLLNCYGSEDVKEPNIQQEESSRGRIMGEIAENVDWQR